MFDPRGATVTGGREDGRARVYDDRDRDDDPRESLMRDSTCRAGRSGSWSRSATVSTS